MIRITVKTGIVFVLITLRTHRARNPGTNTITRTGSRHNRTTINHHSSDPCNIPSISYISTNLHLELKTKSSAGTQLDMTRKGSFPRVPRRSSMRRYSGYGAEGEDEQGSG